MERKRGREEEGGGREGVQAPFPLATRKHEWNPCFFGERKGGRATAFEPPLLQPHDNIGGIFILKQNRGFSTFFIFFQKKFLK